VTYDANGNSYPSGVSATYNGDASVNAITLLHELGHAFNDLFGKGSSTIINDTNWRGKVNQAAEDANAEALRPCAK